MSNYAPEQLGFVVCPRCLLFVNLICKAGHSAVNLMKIQIRVLAPNRTIYKQQI